MQNTSIKHIMDIDMFCCIHEGGDWLMLIMESSNTLAVEPFVLRLISICRMLCGTLNLQSNLVKLEFTVKCDPSLLILLCDNASFVCSGGMKSIVGFMYLQQNVLLLTTRTFDVIISLPKSYVIINNCHVRHSCHVVH